MWVMTSNGVQRVRSVIQFKNVARLQDEPALEILVVPDYSNAGGKPDIGWLTGKAPLPLGAWVAVSSPDSMLGRSGRNAVIPEETLTRWPWLTARLSKRQPRQLQPLAGIIPDGPIGDDVRRIVAGITALGGQSVLVGGSVRDALLGRDNKDYDIEIRGVALEKLEAFLMDTFPDVGLVGKSFAVYKVGNFIDVSVPRTEVKTDAGHQGFEVHPDPFLSATEAAARRDFTVNAIGVDLATGELVDPYNGVKDLERGMLRHVSPRFSEDPLRVLRAMQFAARMDLVLDAGTIQLCNSLISEKATLATERVAEEYTKLLTKASRPSLGIITLVASGWAEPELLNLAGSLSDGPGDALAATAFTLDQMTALKFDDVTEYERLTLGLGALTARMPEKDARSLIRKVSIFADSAKDTNRVTRAAWGLLESLSDSGMRNLAETANGLKLPLMLARALNPGLGKEHFDELTHRAVELGVLESRVAPLVTGDDAIALGVKPSPALGALLKKVRTAQLDGMVSTRDEALSLLNSSISR